MQFQQVPCFHRPLQAVPGRSSEASPPPSACRWAPSSARGARSSRSSRAACRWKFASATSTTCYPAPMTAKSPSQGRPIWCQSHRQSSLRKSASLQRVNDLEQQPVTLARRGTCSDRSRPCAVACLRASDPGAQHCQHGGATCARSPAAPPTNELGPTMLQRRGPSRAGAAWGRHTQLNRGSTESSSLPVAVRPTRHARLF